MTQQDSGDFTLGVEEEYQIVDPATRALCQRVQPILDEADPSGGTVEAELRMSQVEIGTPVCKTLDDVRAALARSRSEVIAAAATDGTLIGAAGTHPFSSWEDQSVTPKPRYLGLAQDHKQIALEQIVFGFHVHVGIRDQESAIQTMNRTYPWLGPMLALGSTSPFWMGKDTGYASFRTDIWGRWPMAGTPGHFSSRAEYDELMEVLVATGSIKEATKIYWDVRPSTRFDTLEFRVTDVCTTVEEAVMIAGLARGLAHRCHAAAVRGEAAPDVRPELVRAAKWHAARHGTEATLIDIPNRTARPAAEVIKDFLDFLRDSLEDLGDWDVVDALVGAALERGTGAARQRRAYERAGRLEDVVDLIVTETAGR